MTLYRIKERIRNTIIRLFMSNKNDLSKIVESEFDVCDCEQKHIINSSIIIRYANESQIRYFRQCYKHYPLKKYLFIAIDDYFDNICSYSQKDLLKQNILEDLSNKKNYKRFVNIGCVFNTRLLDILAGVYCDYNSVGLSCFANHDNEQFISFIKYINCAIINQRINSYVKNGSYENNSANKQLATYRLAKYLSLDSLVPEVKVCRIAGTDKLGTLMDNAPGIPPSEILPEKRVDLDKSTFLRDITNLEFFDAICYQLDHRLDNYHVIENEQGQIANVIAFDNDANRTFFVSSKFPQRTYAGATCVTKGKFVNRPYIDASFAKSFLNVDKRSLLVGVGDFVSRSQFKALWKRIKRLKKAIKNTVKHNPSFFVEDWNDVDINELADEKYGKTYFNLYLNDTLMLDRKKQFDKIKKQ